MLGSHCRKEVREIVGTKAKAYATWLSPLFMARYDAGRKVVERKLRRGLKANHSLCPYCIRPSFHMDILSEFVGLVSARLSDSCCRTAVPQNTNWTCCCNFDDGIVLDRLEGSPCNSIICLYGTADDLLQLSIEQPDMAEWNGQPTLWELMAHDNFCNNIPSLPFYIDTCHFYITWLSILHGNREIFG